MSIQAYPAKLTVGKSHIQLEETTFPDGVLLSRDSAIPALHVQDSLGRANRFRDEAKDAIATPLFSVWYAISA